jgi:hypothetical protein
MGKQRMAAALAKRMAERVAPFQAANRHAVDGHRGHRMEVAPPGHARVVVVGCAVCDVDVLAIPYEDFER